MSATNATSTAIPRWTIPTTASFDQYQQALNSLTETIPHWIGKMQHRRIHHAEPDQRLHDNTVLSSILLLENDAIRLRKQPQRNLRASLYSQRRHYPDELDQLANRLIEYSDALFGYPDDRIIIPCWFDHTVLPGPDTVLLQDIRELWKHHYDRIVKEQADLIEPFYYEWPSELSIDALPSRTAIRTGQNTRQGWTNVTLQPDSGYDALLSVARTKRDGTTILQQYET